MTQKIFNIIILLAILYLLGSLDVFKMQTKREVARFDRLFDVIEIKGII
jgi:hypothetical protein